MTKTRVLLCTSGGLCGSLSLQALLEMEDVDVVGLFVSTRTRTRHGHFIGDAMRIARTSGLNYACYLAMGTTVFEGLRIPGILPTINHLARKHGVPCFHSGDINSERAQNWLKEKKPDVLLSSFFNLKLSPATLSIPVRAAVNLHPAQLPAYKGVDPVFYYFLNNENDLGVSLHQMADEFDTGKILAQASMPVIPNRSVFWHNTELFRVGLRLFQEWILGNTTEPAVTNTPVTDQYDSWPTPRQVNQLKKPLWRFTDLWEQSRRPF